MATTKTVRFEHGEVLYEATVKLYYEPAFHPKGKLDDWEIVELVRFTEHWVVGMDRFSPIWGAGAAVAGAVVGDSEKISDDYSLRLQENDKFVEAMLAAAEREMEGD